MKVNKNVLLTGNWIILDQISYNDDVTDLLRRCLKNVGNGIYAQCRKVFDLAKILVRSSEN